MAGQWDGRVNTWARLENGDRALRLLDNQLRTVEGRNPNRDEVRWGGGTYINLFDSCPPFQIDGNYGACAGIAEMYNHGKTDRVSSQTESLSVFYYEKC